MVRFDRHSGVIGCCLALPSPGPGWLGHHLSCVQNTDTGDVALRPGGHPRGPGRPWGRLWLGLSDGGVGDGVVGRSLAPPSTLPGGLLARGLNMKIEIYERTTLN